ncbi:MAG: hypothetical protein GY746_02710 [Gammaproteobacteria bacterium]|nr:hypothetical protein [Gammaproteobacteria bacterium]
MKRKHSDDSNGTFQKWEPVRLSHDGHRNQEVFQRLSDHSVDSMRVGLNHIYHHDDIKMDRIDPHFHRNREHP